MKNIIIIICVFTALFIVRLFDENKNLKESLKENATWVNKPATTTVVLMNSIPKDILTKICEDKGGYPTISAISGFVCDVYGDDRYYWDWERDNFIKVGLVELK